MFNNSEVRPAFLTPNHDKRLRDWYFERIRRLQREDFFTRFE